MDKKPTEPIVMKRIHYKYRLLKIAKFLVIFLVANYVFFGLTRNYLYSWMSLSDFANQAFFQTFIYLIFFILIIIKTKEISLSDTGICFAYGFFINETTIFLRNEIEEVHVAVLSSNSDISLDAKTPYILYIKPTQKAMYKHDTELLTIDSRDFANPSVLIDWIYQHQIKVQFTQNKWLHKQIGWLPFILFVIGILGTLLSEFGFSRFFTAYHLAINHTFWIWVGSAILAYAISFLFMWLQKKSLMVCIGGSFLSSVTLTLLFHSLIINTTWLLHEKNPPATAQYAAQFYLVNTHQVPTWELEKLWQIVDKEGKTYYQKDFDNRALHYYKLYVPKDTPIAQYLYRDDFSLIDESLLKKNRVTFNVPLYQQGENFYFYYDDVKITKAH